MKKSIFLLIILLLLGSLAGCSSKHKEIENAKYSLYYISKDGNKLESEGYNPTSNDPLTLVRELLTVLSTDSKHLEYKRPINDSMIIKELVLRDNGQLSINFDVSYNNMDKITEILSRAAIVKTICQIEAVDYVEFIVDGQPLMDSNAKPIGLMSADSFVDNTINNGTKTQNTAVTLFFANGEGDELVETYEEVPYDGSVTKEQFVINLLIAGPTKEGIYATVPSDTSLIKVTTKDNTCYVDFNEKFLNKLPNITDEVAIYSVVNTLAELPSINKVQFKINGELKAKYRENLAFDGLFQRNLDLVASEPSE